jgi:hypothetical protein
MFEGQREGLMCLYGRDRSLKIRNLGRSLRQFLKWVGVRIEGVLAPATNGARPTAAADLKEAKHMKG